MNFGHAHNGASSFLCDADLDVTSEELADFLDDIPVSKYPIGNAMVGNGLRLLPVSDCLDLVYLVTQMQGSGQRFLSLVEVEVQLHSLSIPVQLYDSSKAS